MFLDDVLRSAEQSRHEVEAMTAQESLEAARLLRGTKTMLSSERQRELAEEMAVRFEERAASVQPSAAP